MKGCLRTPSKAVVKAKRKKSSTKILRRVEKEETKEWKRISTY
jgi:hypothetical protein